MAKKMGRVKDIKPKAIEDKNLNQIKKIIKSAKESIDKGNFERAEKLLETALKIDQHDAGVLYMMGLLMIKQEKEDLAEKFLLKSIKYKYNPWASLHLGKLYRKQGKFDLAIQVLKKSLEENKNGKLVDDLKMEIANTYREQGENGSIQEVYEEIPEYKMIVDNYNEKSRKKHILRHTVDDKRKDSHSVFLIKNPIQIIEKFLKNKSKYPKIINYFTELYCVKIPNCGYAGGKIGNGKILDYMTIVLLANTDKILTAMPSENIFLNKGLETIEMEAEINMTKLEYVKRGKGMNKNRAIFEETLLRQDMLEFYLNSSKEAIIEFFGEQFSNVPEFKQNNPHHQYDLFEHILRTVQEVPNDDKLIIVKIAAFLHDIGKPEVVQEKNGKQVYYGHAKKSAEMAQEVLIKLGYSYEEIEKINFLIEHHDDFIGLKTTSEINIEKISGILSKISNTATTQNTYNPTISDYKMLLQLCKADASAQKEIVQQDDAIIDTKKDKIDRIQKIEQILPEAIVFETNRKIQGAQSKIEILKNGVSPVIREGKVLNQSQIDIWNKMTSEEKEEKIEQLKNEIKILSDEKARLLEEQEIEK